MPQVRIMGDDPDHVEQVTTLLLVLIDVSPALTAGDPTRLRHRSGGGRIVFDVNTTSATGRRTAAARPERVRAERLDNQPATRPRRTPRRRELPPPDGHRFLAS
ncbi:hypothetical protein ACIBKY_55125 [Nonomuraea sp. NPDC050394]|uniref:hypothetical protein n=1 Tax=Nonomuraea sp. NPDC050394 TaxID=3364363 RepID=UPI0037BB8980